MATRFLGKPPTRADYRRAWTVTAILCAGWFTAIFYLTR